MKKLFYLLLMMMPVMIVACGGKKDNIHKETVLTKMDSVDAHGLQRMQTSRSEVDVKLKGKDYHSLVLRTPDEKLPHVKSEMGDLYVDNKIQLHLTCAGKTILDKTFTKNDFSSVIDADFLSKAVLEGLVYDKTTDQKIIYAASVCYPQTDLYIPISIAVTPDGKLDIQRVELIEEGY